MDIRDKIPVVKVVHRNSASALSRAARADGCGRRMGGEAGDPKTIGSQHRRAPRLRDYARDDNVSAKWRTAMLQLMQPFWRLELAACVLASMLHHGSEEADGEMKRKGPTCCAVIQMFRTRKRSDDAWELGVWASTGFRHVSSARDSRVNIYSRAFILSASIYSVAAAPAEDRPCPAKPPPRSRTPVRW